MTRSTKEVDSWARRASTAQDGGTHDRSGTQCTSDENINADLVRRARRANVRVLVVSVDVPVNSNRERNRRNGFSRRKTPPPPRSRICTAR